MSVLPGWSWVRLVAVAACAGACAGAVLAEDCNLNGRPDSEDLASGSSADRNANGEPDECEVAPLELSPVAELAGSSSVEACLLEDADGDGLLDLVVPRVDWRGNVSLQVFPNRGEAGWEGEDEAPAFPRMGAQGIGGNRFIGGTASFRGAGGGVPGAVTAAGDFDRDGDRDVVVSSSRGLSLARGDGDGGFEELESLGAAVAAAADSTASESDESGLVEIEPGVFIVRGANQNVWQLARRARPGVHAAAAAGDLDGDQAADLILGRQDGGVEVLRGARESPLGPGGRIDAGEGSILVALGDADADGDLDLVTASAAAGRCEVRRNDGQGRLGGAEPLPAAAVTPGALLVADLDGQAGAEVVLAGPEGAAIIAAGAARESSRSPSLLPLFEEEEEGRVTAAAVDLDGDGDRDLAAGHGEIGAVTCALGRGDGSFVARASAATSAPVAILAAGDLTGSGRGDLIVAPLHGAGVQVLRSQEGAAGGELDMLPERVSLGIEPHSSVLADLDGDRDLDFAVIDGEVDIHFYENRGGRLVPRRSQTVGAALEMISLLGADLDGDGDVDLVTSDEATDRIHVHRNDGRWRFSQQGTFFAGERPMQVVPGDWNGDGTLDLAAVSQSANSATLYEGTGEFSFRPRGATSTGASPMSCAAGDFNGDRLLDLAVACYSSSEVQLLLGDGKGAFPRRKSLRARWPTYVQAADLNGDGRLDLAVASHSSRSVVLFLGEGAAGFAAAATVPIGQPPYTLLAADLNGDSSPELITANPNSGTLSVLLNDGVGGLSAARTLPAGSDPRFASAGDLDGDGDVDLIASNHTSLDLTIFANRSRRTTRKPYLERVATEAELHAISIPARDGAPGETITKFTIPLDPAAGGVPAVFQDVHRYPLHQQFLAEVFSTQLPALTPEAHDRLTGRRATRRYWVGTIRRTPTPSGPIHGFNLLAGYQDDPREAPGAEEVRAAFTTLGAAFLLRPLVYWPDPGPARDATREWSDPGFPLHGQVHRASETRRTAAMHAYTAGVGYGRVRILRAADLAAPPAASFQDLLVLERAPRDIEGVVAGIVTAEPQGELSHLAVRTARRGTPNIYLASALEVFEPLAGKLVRLEAAAGSYRLTEATAAEAEAWWEKSRPTLSEPSRVDAEYAELDDLDTMDLSGDRMPPEARYGGKATNFARLRRLLTGPFERYREEGFAIPMRWYFDFLRENRMPSAVDPSRTVTYEEHLRELQGWPEFQTDSQLRSRVLETFRLHARAEGEVPPERVRRLARRIEEVFGSTTRSVRFRSSSNVEDALEFNGAGLYDSTAACAADDLDDDDVGPCRCDPSRPLERGIAKALKTVWTSLWNFRAHEERAHYGIPQELAAMGILVSLAYPDERANGVAFTGNPASLADRRYVVTSQPGEESVVSPEPGVLPERDLIEVAGGEVRELVRSQASTLVQEGELVLSEAELRELGALLAHVDSAFPVDPGPHSRRDILLDFEFKIDADGCLAVKQVRPFLARDAGPASPTFVLQVPEGAVACGSFVPTREPLRAFELKSVLRFRPGTVELPMAEPTFSADLVDELRVGPGAGAATPAGPGTFHVERSQEGPTTLFRLRHEQSFTLPGGELFQLELGGIELRGRGAEPITAPIVLDAGYLTRRLTLQGSAGAVISYASCDCEPLKLWEIEAVAVGGTRIRLLERHDPPANPNETTLGALVRAEISFGGRTLVVDEYARLVYTALRHNRGPKYWVVLDPAVPLPRAARPVRVVEVSAPEPRLDIEARVRYLSTDLEELASLRLTAFERREANGTPPPRLSLEE